MMPRGRGAELFRPQRAPFVGHELTAALTRSGRNGVWRRRTPMASNTARGRGGAERGQVSPGDVPTKKQATTQPSVRPNGVGAMQNERPGGDYGPGGAPTTGQAATTPSRNGR